MMKAAPLTPEQPSQRRVLVVEERLHEGVETRHRRTDGWQPGYCGPEEDASTTRLRSLLGNQPHTEHPKQQTAAVHHGGDQRDVRRAEQSHDDGHRQSLPDDSRHHIPPSEGLPEDPGSFGTPSGDGAGCAGDGPIDQRLLVVRRREAERHLQSRVQRSQTIGHLRLERPPSGLDLRCQFPFILEQAEVEDIRSDVGAEVEDRQRACRRPLSRSSAS